MTEGLNLLFEEEVPHLVGRAWEVKKGQYIRIVGRHTVDFVAFNSDNLRESFDQARTKTNQLKLFVTTGDVLYSKDNNVMLTITGDTWPWHHDIEIGMCSRKKFEMSFLNPKVVKRQAWEKDKPAYGWERWEDLPPRGCWENLTEALKPWKLEKWDVPSPFNIFWNLKIDGDTGKIYFDHKHLDDDAPDAMIEMRAEMDLIVAGANDIDGPEPFKMQILEP